VGRYKNEGGKGVEGKPKDRSWIKQETEKGSSVSEHKKEMSNGNIEPYQGK